MDTGIVSSVTVQSDQRVSVTVEKSANKSEAIEDIREQLQDLVVEDLEPLGSTESCKEMQSSNYVDKGKEVSKVDLPTTYV